MAIHDEAGEVQLNDQQDLRPYFLLFWGLSLVSIASIFFRDALATGAGLSIDGQAIWGRDFVNVFTSGTLVLEGNIRILYDAGQYQAYQAELFHGGLQNHLFSYPPATLLYAWLFALVPYPVAFALWVIGTGSLFTVAARPYLREAGLPGWVAWLAPASLVNIWAGHYGFLIGGLWLLAWSQIGRRPVLAGILIGLMLMKPHLAVLAPIALVWRREWMAFIAASVTTLALLLISAAIFGPDLWLTYVTETSVQHAVMVDDVGSFFLYLMPTLFPALAMLGASVALAGAIQAFVGLATLLLCLKYLPEDDRRAGLAIATATFLILPYAFIYDMTVVGLAGLLLFKSTLEEGRKVLGLIVGAAAIIPAVALYLNISGLPVAPILIAVQLAVLLRLTDKESPKPQPRAGGL